MVPEIIEQKKSEIAALCRTYRIRALWLFGSAVTGAWDPATSDFDFLVDLGEYEDAVVYRYLDLADALEELLGRKVDLVTVRSVRSPLFRQELHETRVLVHESRNGKEAA